MANGEAVMLGNVWKAGEEIRSSLRCCVVSIIIVMLGLLLQSMVR